MKRGISVAALLPLAACAVGPNYRAPTPRPAATAPLATTQATDASDTLPDRWWSLYADPVLDALVEEALTHNSDVRVAAANLELAQAVLSEARGALLPTTQVTGGITYGRGTVGQTGIGTAVGNNGGIGTGTGSGTGGGTGTGGSGTSTGTATTTNNTRTIYRGGFQLSYEVDLFGRIRRSLEAARADVAAAEADRDAARVTIAAATTQAYFDTCLLGVRIDVARNSLRLVSQSYDITRRQVQLGAGSDYDIARIGVLVEQTRAQAAQLEGLRGQALADLTRLLGRPAGDPAPAAVACRAGPRLTRPIPTGDGARLLARRPDVRAAERRLGADTARIGVATADLFPTVSLGGSVNAVGTGINSATSRRGLSFGIGPLISWFFPNIVAARARIAQADATARASLARFDGTVVTALSEVQAALAVYDAEINRNRALSAAVANSRRAYDLSNVRVRYGSISQLEQIDVQRDLVATEAALAESDATLGQAQVTLFRALGGGWQDARPSDPRPTAVEARIPGK